MRPGGEECRPSGGRWLRDALREDPLQAGILARDVRDAGVRRIWATLREAVADPVADKLPRVTAPGLVLRGGVEPIVPPRWARQAAGLLPDGRWGTVPGSPHNAVYVAAERLAHIVERFVAAHAGAPQR